MSIDIMIAGAPRSGSTTLLAHLGAHPSIEAPKVVEMTWFADSQLYSGPFPESVYFGAPRGERLRVGKLAALMYRDDDIRRLLDLSPQVQIVVILRDPTPRAHSDYWFARRRGQQPETSFREQMLAEMGHSEAAPVLRRHMGDHAAGYLHGSLYLEPVERLERAAGRDSVHVIIQEEFLEDPRRALRSLASRLGLDLDGFAAEPRHMNAQERPRSTAAARLRHDRRLVRTARALVPPVLRRWSRAGYRSVNYREERTPDMDGEVEALLRGYFAEPNRLLETHLGRRIEAWPSPPR